MSSPLVPVSSILFKTLCPFCVYIVNIVLASLLVLISLVVTVDVKHHLYWFLSSGLLASTVLLISL